MRRMFISTAILIFLLNLPGYAQKTRRLSKSTNPQVVEKPCAPADWYNNPKTEVQQQNVNKLASDLMAIKWNVPVTQSQISILTGDLLAIADDATRLETELIRNVAEKLAKTISSRKIPNKIKARIAEDVWMVLNVTRFRSASVSANARINNQLSDFGVSPTDLDYLRIAFNSITSTVGNNIQ